MSDNKASWVISELEDLEMKRVVELSSQGMSQRDIADEMGIHRSKVYRILNKQKSGS